MKTTILISAIIVAGIGTVYIWQKPILQDKQNSTQPQIINSADYARVAADISKQINDISPTPPTADTWIVRDVEFVKNEPYAYVVYHDTHNIFRILVETGWRPYQPDQKIMENTFQTIAAFEADSTGWRLTGGEDLARLPAPPPDTLRESKRAGEGAADGGQAKAVIVYIYNPELKLWVERKE